MIPSEIRKENTDWLTEFFYVRIQTQLLIKYLNDRLFAMIEWM